MSGACCPSCSVGAACESGCNHGHGHDGVIVGAHDHVGDFGSDFLNVLRSIDDAVSTVVVEPVLDALAPTGLGQYTNIIRDIHDTRRSAQEAAAPRTGPGGVPGFRASPARPPAGGAPSMAPALPGAAPASSATVRARAARKPSGGPARAMSTSTLNSILSAMSARPGGMLLSAPALAATVTHATSPRGRIQNLQSLVRRAAAGERDANEELVRIKEAAARGVAEATRNWGIVVRVMRDERKAIERAAR